MKQYCRYCLYLFVNNVAYCYLFKKYLSESVCKCENHCSGFEFADLPPEYQDAFGETGGYKPRQSGKHYPKTIEVRLSFDDFAENVQKDDKS